MFIWVQPQRNLIKLIRRWISNSGYVFDENQTSNLLYDIKAGAISKTILVMVSVATYWKLSMRRCRGFTRVLELRDSVKSTLSSCTAACWRARSDSSRVFCRKEADRTGAESGSPAPLQADRQTWRTSQQQVQFTYAIYGWRQCLTSYTKYIVNSVEYKHCCCTTNIIMSMYSRVCLQQMKTLY